MSNKLTDRGYPELVNMLAKSAIQHLPASVELDDLLQSGMIGYLEAKKSYDPEQGANFNTFARIRIKGAMIDSMRTGDWTPRKVHKMRRAITQATTQLTGELKRKPKNTEIAKAVELPLEEYFHTVADISNCYIVEIDEESDVFVNADDIAKSCEYDNIRVVVDAIVAELNTRQRAIYAMRYKKAMSLKEIAAHFNVTESRASQCCTEITQLITEKLNRGVCYAFTPVHCTLYSKATGA